MKKQEWPKGPFSLPDEEQFDKEIKKQRVVRNEFLTTGYFGIPIIRKQEIDLKKNRFMGLQQSKSQR